MSFAIENEEVQQQHRDQEDVEEYPGPDTDVHQYPFLYSVTEAAAANQTCLMAEYNLATG